MDEGSYVEQKRFIVGDYEFVPFRDYDNLWAVPGHYVSGISDINGRRWIVPEPMTTEELVAFASRLGVKYEIRAIAIKRSNHG